MKKGKIKRNGLTDLMRLVFALIVMMFHFYNAGEKHFPGGFFGVEYFSILAGFLSFSAWDREGLGSLSSKERQSYWLNYMKRRYVRFFWCSLLAFIYAFLVTRVWIDGINGFAEICDSLSGDIWEILLVKMNGINRGRGLLVGTTWTMSCMLYVEFFILGALVFWERPFLLVLMPMSVVVGTGCWSNLEVNTHATFLTFTTFGMLRVYVLMCVGIFAYWICRKLEKIHFSNRGRWILTTIELMGYAICVLITCYQNSRYYQFCFTLIAMLVLAISFSGKSFAGSILPASRFTNFCAELSLSIYLTHYTVYRVFRYLYEDANEQYRQKFVFLACALAVALAYTYIMRGVFKVLPIMKEKLKSVMLEQP